ncbi:hypothetical protein DBR40_09025 [Pedobacter sp. KBW01]|uniref:hypothetical protein n=1 Tax=Pedobacter sp. KBW01 TaxID=2153364 RepID=UPI000F59A85A|nr:hypothetical protein [Pedobacter sp. KBW01]RQO78081.1 hypothetical protein DBR40_09025 [Pedobacter sp. KBW01]
MSTITKVKEESKTHIEECREFDLNLIENVCMLLGWSTEQYCEYQLDNYNQFVDRLFYGFPVQMANEVKYSSDFRGFWNNEASFRNQTEFLPFAKFEPMESPVILSEFLYTHNPLTLMHDDLFMMKYNNVLEKIRKGKKCQ